MQDISCADLHLMPYIKKAQRKWHGRFHPLRHAHKHFDTPVNFWTRPLAFRQARSPFGTPTPTPCSTLQWSGVTFLTIMSMVKKKSILIKMSIIKNKAMNNYGTNDLQIIECKLIKLY